MTPPPALRSCTGIAASVIAFSLLIERAGLMPAVAATVLVASLGGATERPAHMLLLALCLAAAAWLLFVVLLGQPFAAIRGL